MICHILACGPSGVHWPGTGFCIGVNDSWKFGKPTSVLLVVNSLSKTPERQRIVFESTPEHGLYSNQHCFISHPKYINTGYLNHFNYKTKIKRGMLYKTSISSPFIAVSLAWKLGFDQFILWGVDFDNHPNIYGQKMQREVENFVNFNRLLNKQGAGIFLGQTEAFTNTGGLSGHLPNYKYA